MSFFKDFKDDLSQAVNELMPEEGGIPGIKGGPQMVDTFTDDFFGKDDIADLLKNIDTIPVPREPEMVAPVMEPVVPVFEPEPVVEQVVAPDPVEPIAPNPAVSAMGAPVFEQIAEPVPVAPAAPAVEKEPVVAPVQPVAAPVAEPVAPAAPVQVEEPVPVVPTYEEPQPVVEKVPVAPVFAQEPEERPAPINTTMVDTSMDTGVVIAGMTITGDVKAEGNLVVRGSVTGNIDVLGKLEITGNVKGNSKAEEIVADSAQVNGEINATGAVRVGQSTVVKGNISATSAVLAGAVKGDIDVQGPVLLDSTAIIMGNIKSKSIQINNGAVIEGLCSQCYADVSPMSFFGEDSVKSEKKK